LTGGVSISRRDSNDCDGSTRDLEGWLVTCEHGARRIIRIEKDGSITLIADSYRGQAAHLAEPRGGEVRRRGTESRLTLI
jgi:gluconolactonase